MAKQRKKRNKPYRGNGSAVQQPVVTKLTAVKRNRLQQWWVERRRFARPVIITSVIVVVIVFLLIELIRIIVR